MSGSRQVHAGIRMRIRILRLVQGVAPCRQQRQGNGIVSSGVKINLTAKADCVSGKVVFGEVVGHRSARRLEIRGLQAGLCGKRPARAPGTLVLDRRHPVSVTGIPTGRKPRIGGFEKLPVLRRFLQVRKVTAGFRKIGSVNRRRNQSAGRLSLQMSPLPVCESGIRGRMSRGGEDSAARCHCRQDCHKPFHPT